MGRTKKVSSEFVSAMGKGFEVVKAISDEVRKQGGGDEHIARVLNEKSLREKIAELLIGKTVTSEAAAPMVAIPLVHTVDLDADPYVPEGWSVEEHKKGGQLAWDKEKVKLYLSERQNGDGYIVGNELRKELEDQPVMNANLLDFLLAHPELIPESWKGKAIFFWGTIYRRADRYLCVRYLDCVGRPWLWHGLWLDGGWHAGYPAAVSAR